jgi:hypothetical protein
MRLYLVMAISGAVLLGLGTPSFATQPELEPNYVCTSALPSVREPQDGPALPQAEYFDGNYSVKILFKRLGLSGRQWKDMATLYAGFKDRTKYAQNTLASLVQEKKEMILSGRIDPLRLAALDDEIATLRSGLYRERLKLIRDRLSVLSPEQLRSLGNLKAGKICRPVSIKKERTAKLD